MNKMLNFWHIEKRAKKTPKILAHMFFFLTFALLISINRIYFYLRKKLKDNTPSRLAEMQHTWGVFSFYTLTLSYCYENL